MGIPCKKYINYVTCVDDDLFLCCNQKPRKLSRVYRPFLSRRKKRKMMVSRDLLKFLTRIYHINTIITPGDADLIDDPIQLLADILPSDFQCIHFWPSVRRNIMTSGFSVQIVQQSGNCPDSLESSWPIHIPTGPWIKLSPRVCTRLERDGWKCRCGEVSPRYENCLMKRVKCQLYDR